MVSVHASSGCMSIGGIRLACYHGGVSRFKICESVLEGDELALAKRGEIFRIEDEQNILLASVFFEGKIPDDFSVNVCV